MIVWMHVRYDSTGILNPDCRCLQATDRAGSNGLQGFSPLYKSIIVIPIGAEGQSLQTRSKSVFEEKIRLPVIEKPDGFLKPVGFAHPEKSRFFK